METLFALWGHPVTITILASLVPIGPLVLYDRLRTLRESKERLEKNLGAAVAERVLNATSVAALRRIVDDLERA